jgi:hypothetical protein
MALSELSLILNKDPIIATYPAEYLRSNPEQVELVYRTHARTHVPIGDTSKYVGTILRWVRGENKGAFIGAVVGDYGHGKTSFQIHVWDQCTQSDVFAVPPFWWRDTGDILAGVAAWVKHVLKEKHAETCRMANKLYDRYRERTIQQAAEAAAQRTGRAVDEVLLILKATHGLEGMTLSLEADPEDLLNYCAELTDLLKNAGFRGLLLLLDEPENAAKSLGSAKVSQILFDLANGLLQRQGDYGALVSIPEKFLASIQRSFASLPARLQGRDCMPRLRDLYGPEFPVTLWDRMTATFGLNDDERQMIAPETLVAIGQVASSDRGDLAYGPRTVISAFSRAAERYMKTGSTYGPIDFVHDCLEAEILVTHEYPTRVRDSLSDATTAGLDESTVKLLAAYPQGVTPAFAFSIGLSEDSLTDFKRAGLVHKRGSVYVLRGLQKEKGASRPDHHELQDLIEEIFTEFAPSWESFATARDAFLKHAVPTVFPRRQGQQLVGWELPEPWAEFQVHGRFGYAVGAFRQTERDYPRRRVALLIGPVGQEVKPANFTSELDDLVDILVHMELRWSSEQVLSGRPLVLCQGQPADREPGLVRVTLDLAGDPISQEWLESFVEPELLTPLGVLNLMGEIDRRQLSHDAQGQWKSLREVLLRKLTARVLSDERIMAQAAVETNQGASGSPADLIGYLTLTVLRKRYPDYYTLIRQPRWTEKVDHYLRALNNQSISLACKRGKEPWIAPKADVAFAFNTNVMNLGDCFNGYEHLVAVRLGARQDQAEVQFRTHPLEQKIMDEIMSNKTGRKLRINGKECWWADFATVRTTLLCSGYQEEEVKKIVEMAKIRGTFLAGSDRGRPVLYCPPLDKEQMRAQLKEKLSELRQDISGLEGLPDYCPPSTIQEIDAEIDRVEDDAHMDSVLGRINRAHEDNKNLLASYFDRLTSSLDQLQRKTQTLSHPMENSRQFSALQSSPTGSSRWCADLGKYIFANLKADSNDIKEKADWLGRQHADVKKTYASNRGGSAPERLDRVKRGFSELDRLEREANDLKTRIDLLLAYLSDYDAWKKVLTQSDELYSHLLQLRQEYPDKGAELLERLEHIWSDITDHLASRNVMGLGSYRQFLDKLASVDSERKNYMQSLRDTFERRKKSMNDLLGRVGLPSDCRVTEVFNPADRLGSDDRLLQQAAKHIAHFRESEVADLLRQRTELVYARDVLGRIVDEAATSIMTRADAAIAKLQQAAEIESPAWLREVVTENDNIAPLMADVRDGFEQARAIARDIRAVLRQSPAVTSSALSETASQMLALMPVAEPMNLKQLILQLIEGGLDPSGALDLALECLAELFMKDKVDIRLGLPRP